MDRPFGEDPRCASFSTGLSILDLLGEETTVDCGPPLNPLPSPSLNYLETPQFVKNLSSIYSRTNICYEKCVMTRVV